MSADAVRAHLQEQLGQLPAAPLVVGFSGGLDSSVLLDGLVRLGLGPTELFPVHVHHGLAPEADAWARHCTDMAAARGLELTVEHADLEPGANLEARARDARYRCLERHLDSGSVLLLAHHRDDQAETLLLRLMRGSGVAGLGGMREREKRNGYWLARPLLQLDRSTLEAAARDRGLAWIEDPDNADPVRDRNYLRHRVRPVFHQRWPAADQALATSAELLQEAGGLLAERAQEDFRACNGTGDQLDIPAVQQLSGPRRRNLLHWWCRQRGIRPPARRLWPQLDRDLLAVPRDRQPRLEWSEGCFARFGDRLYLLHPDELAPVTASAIWTVDTDTLDFGPFRLFRAGADQAELWLRSPDTDLSVCAASGGERLFRHGMHKRLVELWREARIPPWQRQQLPLFHAGDTLVAAAGAGVADDWQPGAHEEGVGIALMRVSGERAL